MITNCLLCLLLLVRLVFLHESFQFLLFFFCFVFVYGRIFVRFIKYMNYI